MRAVNAPSETVPDNQKAAPDSPVWFKKSAFLLLRQQLRVVEGKTKSAASSACGVTTRERLDPEYSFAPCAMAVE